MLKYILCGVIVFLGCNMGVIPGAIALLGTLIYIVYSNMPAILSINGNKAMNNGDYEKALSMYKKAVNTKRASASVELRYGMLLLRCGHPDEAVGVFNSIILYSKTKGQEKLTAKQYRAMAYHKLGQKDDAMEEAEELFETFKNSITYGIICYLKLAYNEPVDEVLPICLEAYDYNSDDRDIIDNLVLAYIRKGEFAKAKELVDTMLEKFPTFTEAYYHGAVVYKNLGENKKACELLSSIKENCRRTYLTTVSEEEIEEMKNSLNRNGEN